MIGEILAYLGAGLALLGALTVLATVALSLPGIVFVFAALSLVASLPVCMIGVVILLATS